VAYAVGRNVGGAVQRNRARRRLRAALHEIRDELEPGSYLVGAGREVIATPFTTLLECARAVMAGAVERS
jgi:ribonuclease P protein component